MHSSIQTTFAGFSIVALALLALPLYADEHDVQDTGATSTRSVMLSIEGLGISVLEHISAPETCSVELDDTIHEFSNYEAVCALVAAHATGTITNLGFGYFDSFGLFLEKVNELPNNESPAGFWEFLHNGTSSMVGISSLALTEGDAIDFVYSEFNTEGPGEEEPPAEFPISVEVAVPASCSVVDSASTTHAFSATGTPPVYLGICALSEAHALGLIEDVALTHFEGFGLFVDSINGITEPDSFWALYHNDEFEMDHGIVTLPITATSTVSLVLTSFASDVLGPRLDIHVLSLQEPASTAEEEVEEELTPAPPASGGGGSGIAPPSFDVAAALSFLGGTQQSDGSFGVTFITDWIALALAAGEHSSARDALRQYLLWSTPAAVNLTDYERRAIALMTLGINPYDGTVINYIEEITSHFDGTQIGDPGLENDDIFALFTLLHAGYGPGDDIIQKSVAFLISRQATNGSWVQSVDVTAAAIQALSLTPSLPGVPDALANAEGYLRTEQQADGGWGNSFSTSWALQAIHTLGQSPLLWAPNGTSPLTYLATAQQGDGGVEPSDTSLQMRQWATAYAIPAVLGKPWGSLLHSFPKPVQPVSSGTIAGAATTTVMMNTEEEDYLEIATSTPSMITTTAFDSPESEVASLVPAVVSIPAPRQAQPSPATESPQEQRIEESSAPSPADTQLAAAVVAEEYAPTSILWILLFLLALGALGALSWPLVRRYI